MSLKKAIRPFLRACHPDASASSTNNKSNSNIGNAPQHHHAKEVNLRAVQTINGLVDSLEILIGRCTPPSYHHNNNNTPNSKKATTTTTTLPELKSRYEIEFILPPNHNVHNYNNDDDETRKRRNKKKNKDDMVASTLRSITITFPEYLRSNVKRWALTSFRSRHHHQQHDGDDDEALLLLPSPTPQEEEAYRTAMQLKEHSLLEFRRLLSIAGMKMPDHDGANSSFSHDQGVGSAPSQLRRKKEGQWTLSDHFLHELGIDPMEEEGRDGGSGQAFTSSSSSSSSAYFGRSQSRPSFPFLGRMRSSSSPSSSSSSPPPPPTYSHPQLQQQRTAFINSIPWNQFALDYDNAYRDAHADFITNRLNLYNINTVEGRERREQMVSLICGKARIITACHRVDDDGGDAEKRKSSSYQSQDDDHDGNNNTNILSQEERVDEDIVPEGLDVIAQLVAIRRLSLLLYDNFDHLQMERMGRMWERLVIVFTPPRTNKRGGSSVRERSSLVGNNSRRGDSSTSSSLVRRMNEDGTPMVRHHPGRKLTKWERRKRHREKMMPVSREWMRHIANSLLGNHKKVIGAGVGVEEAVGFTDKSSGYVNDDGSTITTSSFSSSSSTSSSPYNNMTMKSESGFKFSYGTSSDQSVGHVTAYIPIDFRDGELVRQLYTHVYDYFDNCCGHVGFLKYDTDGEIRATNNNFAGGG